MLSINLQSKKSCRDGLHSYVKFLRQCPPCLVVTKRKHQESPQAVATRQRARVHNHRMWQENSIKTRYGIDYEDFAHMLVAQGFRCSGCLVLFRTTRYLQSDPDAPCVDHCHKTGKVRGLLCQRCNRALGMVSDSAPALRRLAEYVERHAK